MPVAKSDKVSLSLIESSSVHVKQTRQNVLQSPMETNETMQYNNHEWAYHCEFSWRYISSWVWTVRSETSPRYVYAAPSIATASVDFGRFISIFFFLLYHKQSANDARAWKAFFYRCGVFPLGSTLTLNTLISIFSLTAEREQVALSRLR